MKSWMKYFILGVVLISAGVLWFVFGASLLEIAHLGVIRFLIWVVQVLLSVLSILFGVCILYELSEQWYRRRSGGVSWVAITYLRFKSWLGKDGL